MPNSSLSFSVIVLTAAPPGADAGSSSGAYVKVDGRECLLRSVDLFVNREGVSQIHLVISEDKYEDSKQKFGGHLNFSGAKLVRAGRQWMEQLAAAAEKISPESTHVILHDAARPAIAFNDLETLMAEADKHPIAVMTTPVRGNLVETEETGKPLALRPGQRFQQIVTPWAMRKDKFLEMIKNKQMPPAPEMWLVRSSSLNIRVAGPGDASLVKSMMSMLPKPKMKVADNPFEEAQW